MREKGGGEGMSLLFFQVFIISISFSHLFLLSLAHTHQVICAICKGEAILPQRSQRQHTTLPPSLKIWCFLLWPINEKCPLSYSKRKKGQWQKKIRNKNSQRSPLYIFFLSKRKEDDAIFFFTDLVTVNDPPPLFLISIKVKCPRVLYKIWPDDPDIFFFFLIWLEQIWLVGTHFSFFKRKLTISVESRPIPRELATCVRGKYLIISSGISCLVEKNEKVLRQWASRQVETRPFPPSLK